MIFEMNVTLVNISLEVSMFNTNNWNRAGMCTAVLLKVSPVTWSTHLSGSAYAHETWAYPTDTVLATVAFLHTTCFHDKALLHAYTATW